MKTLLKQSIRCLLLAMFVMITLSDASASVKEEYMTVSGVVKDQKTKKKLEYVTISVAGSNTSTITNSDGEFSLKVNLATGAKNMEISHVGYLNEKISLADANEPKTYYLRPSDHFLKEVIVRPEYARELVQHAINRIEYNYSKIPNMFTGFYRETVQKGKRYIQVSEAVVDIYKEPYTEGIDKDRVRVSKGRKLISIKNQDTLAVKLMGGPYISVLVDVVKNKDVLFDKETLNNYEYSLENPVNLDNRLQYVVSFRPIVMLPYALYNGKYYIDKETLTFTRIEISLDMRDREKAISSMLIRKPFGLHFKPYEANILITYKQQNGVSYLNYIRTESIFKCDWKSRLFSSKYAVVSEVVTTERNDKPMETIPYKESFKKSQVLSDNLTNFADADFWGNYNIIAPTESLLEGVAKLKKQHQ